ncbi:hypothetical protein B0H16DRAFT_1472555 [Mycena metata]|uniref:Uncharacterized protein n=1 Tax=Mycena metata TaxID=1033252 RepID=A0AAD7MMB6_9AGAR|nr:hypothetical protein B0H16DRAFT_1472555 [Mycena metata]
MCRRLRVRMLMPVTDETLASSLRSSFARVPEIGENAVNVVLVKISVSPLLGIRVQLAMAQARSPGLASQAYGFGSGFNVNEPKPGQAKPKPWFPGQAKPAHH